VWSRSAFGLDVCEGHVPVVVYAPHAARRGRPIHRGDGVNDLYTDEIARELAETLGAHGLVNPSIDRNDEDLNRVSVLSSSAQPALVLLRALVERASRDGADPLVLIVHGWNVTMPACDIGIGLTTRNGRIRGAHPTVSRATHERFVKDLIDELARRGIVAPVGLRYPASSRDNATQLFSGRHADHEHPEVSSLSALAARGAVDAVQLELAIPLRWPGAYRAHFLDALIAAVRGDVDRRRSAGRSIGPARAPRSEWILEARTSRRDARRPKLPAGWSLQAVFGDGSGLFAGAEPAGESEAAARLCVVRPDGRMLLFVGEDEWAGDERSFRVGGLRLTATLPQGADVRDRPPATGAGSATHDEARSRRLAPEKGTVVRLMYAGPMVIYPSHDAFCDLETGLAGSELVTGASDLTFAAEDDGFGRLRGVITCGDETLHVDVLAVCERRSRRSGAAQARSRVFVTHGPWSPAVLGERHDSWAGAGVERERSDAKSIRAGCEWRLGGDGEVSQIGCFFEDGGTTDARVLMRVPVYRALADALVVKVTFGTARVEHANGEASLAVFEHVELIPEE